MPLIFSRFFRFFDRGNYHMTSELNNLVQYFLNLANTIPLATGIQVRQVQVWCVHSIPMVLPLPNPSSGIPLLNPSEHACTTIPPTVAAALPFMDPLLLSAFQTAYAALFSSQAALPAPYAYPHIPTVGEHPLSLSAT